MNRSIFCMKSKDFEWLTDEFMLYCPCLRLQLTPETKTAPSEKMVLFFCFWLSQIGRCPGMNEVIVIYIAVDIMNDIPDVVVLRSLGFKNIPVLVCNIADAPV